MEVETLNPRNLSDSFDAAMHDDFCQLALQLHKLGYLGLSKLQVPCVQYWICVYGVSLSLFVSICIYVCMYVYVYIYIYYKYI